MPRLLVGDGESRPVRSDHDVRYVPMLTRRPSRAFAIQCPLVLIGLLLTELKLQTPSSHGSKGEAEDILTWHKLRRIDWFGVILLSITILSALGLLSVGGTKLPWSDWRVLTGMAVAVMAGTAFALVEKYHAVDPIFAVRLMTHPAVLTAYTTLAMQNIAVTGVRSLVR